MRRNPRLPAGCERHAQWLLEREATERALTVEAARTAARLLEFFERWEFGDSLSNDEFDHAQRAGLSVDREDVRAVREFLADDDLARGWLKTRASPRNHAPAPPGRAGPRGSHPMAGGLPRKQAPRINAEPTRKQAPHRT